MILSYVFVTLVGVYTLAAAMLDLRLRRIPNYLTVPAAVAGLTFHVLAPSGWGALTSLGGFALGFSLLILPWMLGGSGMGDVKLLAALGAWLGPKLMLVAFAASMAAAATIAIGVLTITALTHGVSRSQKRLIAARRGELRGRPRLLPFAVPVAVSTWFVLAWVFTQGTF